MAQMPPTGAPSTGPTPNGVSGAFVDPIDKFWSLYIEDAEKYDEVRLARWKGDADGILVFTGLFAATVATFVVSTIPNLSSDSGDQTAVLLSQVLSVLVNNTENGALPSSAPANYTFEVPSSALWINSLWLVSLFLSLVCALAATLVQQWTRIYSQAVNQRGSPSTRGLRYAAMAAELENFHVEDAVSWIVSLLHIAVFLFFIGVLVMLFSINHRIGLVLAVFMATGALGYMVLSALPIITYRSPYRTPLSLPLRAAAIAVLDLCERVCQHFYYKSYGESQFLRNLGLRKLAQTFSYTNFWHRTEAIRETLEQLRAKSVAANVSNWAENERDEYRIVALRQLRPSIDQLNEAETFCSALTVMLDSYHNSPDILRHDYYGEAQLALLKRSFALRASIVKDLNIFSLLRQLLADASDNKQLSELISGRRIRTAMSLICALLWDVHRTGDELDIDIEVLQALDETGGTYIRFSDYTFDKGHQLNEAETFCRDLTTIIDSFPNRLCPESPDHVSGEDERLTLWNRSLTLRVFIVRNLGIFKLLKQLLRDASDNQQLSESTGSRRIQTAMSLIRALLRDCHRRLTLEITTSLSYTDCITFSKYSFDKGRSRRMDAMFSYFFASIRADILGRNLDLSASDSKIWEIMSIFVTSENGAWLHDLGPSWEAVLPDLNVDEATNNDVEEGLRMCEALLDNFLWIFDKTIDLVSTNDGLALFQELQNVWMPLIESSYAKVISHVPFDMVLSKETIDDLQRLVRKLEMTSSQDDPDRSSRAVEGPPIEDLANGVHVPLLDKYPMLGQWLAHVCRRMKGPHRCEPPEWLLRYGQGFPDEEAEIGRDSLRIAGVTGAPGTIEPAAPDEANHDDIELQPVTAPQPASVESQAVTPVAPVSDAGDGAVDYDQSGPGSVDPADMV